MEPLSSLEDVQGEVDLCTVTLAVDLVERILQVQPEGDLLQGRPTGCVTLQLGHLWGRRRGGEGEGEGRGEREREREREREEREREREREGRERDY